MAWHSSIAASFSFLLLDSYILRHHIEYEHFTSSRIEPSPPPSPLSVSLSLPLLSLTVVVSILNSLPRGEKARRVVGADTAIGKTLAAALEYTWTETEETVLLEEPETFDAALIQEEEEEAKKEAEKARPGLTMFTDGSRLDNGAAGYAVTWKRGESWAGIKTHLGFTQEAYDAECAALARARWKAPHGGRQPRNGSRSSPTRKRPSSGWHRRSLAPARSTRSRPGNTSAPYGGPDRASSSKSGGAQHTRVWQAMRKRTSGPNSWRMSLMPAGWNGRRTRTGQGSA